MTPLESFPLLEQRFELLREVIAGYRERHRHLEQEVIRHFTENRLDAISSCIREKERWERLIEQLEQFVERWEGANNSEIEEM
jgi:sensor histidine kinase YesM